MLLPTLFVLEEALLEFHQVRVVVARGIIIWDQIVATTHHSRFQHPCRVDTGISLWVGDFMLSLRTILVLRWVVLPLGEYVNLFSDIGKRNA